MKTTVASLAALSLLACAKADNAADSTKAAANSAPAPAPMKMGETTGMDVPESVKYDPDLDVFFVSNIVGNPSNKDGQAFIAVVRADSTNVMKKLVESGKPGAGGKGVALNAPKGLAISGDTLWVADIDVVHAINKRTGARILEAPVPGATFLNDVAVGPDGIYVTDTGIKFDATGNVTHPGVNRIFKIVASKAKVAVSIAAEGDSLMSPNGLTWDKAGNRWLLAPFGGPDVQTLAAGAKNPSKLASGPGQYDGIEILADGRIIVSSWADSAVHVISGGAMSKMIPGLSAPADIGVDTKRALIAVPRFNDKKVEYYMIH